MWKRLLAMIKFRENYCWKHTGSSLFPWRMFWIHVSHAVNFQMFWNVRNWTRYIKKKDNLAEENYRLVSVLTALSKIYDQLLQHFITIFNDFLSAYRKGYSCQSLLVKVIDDWKSLLITTTSSGLHLWICLKHLTACPILYWFRN